MQKRLILAMALSMLVLLVWSALFPKPQILGNKEVMVTKLSSQIESARTAPMLNVQDNALPVRTVKIERKNWDLIFDESGASVLGAQFKNFQLYQFNLKYALLLQNMGSAFQRSAAGSGDEVSFISKYRDLQVIKRFNVSNSKYTIELDIETSNLSNASVVLDYPLILGVLNFAASKSQMNLQNISVATQEKIEHLNGRKDLIVQNIKTLGLRERYFCAIIQPESGSYSAFIRKINPQETEVGLIAQNLQLAPGQSLTQKFFIYIGPQDLKLINAANPAWVKLINFGAFDFISRIVLNILEFLYGLVHNWGLAIIGLSILVYIVLYPLSVKQMRSMKEMQALQPRIEELRGIYKDNPQKLNKEIMLLYREHKVNPLGGCLPLVLQIPIFFALYQALIRFVALKGATFLWIKDLSEPDRLFLLPVSLPFLGNEVNMLPILMAIGMFIQQKISLKSASGSSAEQQKMMMIIMPIMFCFIFYHMSSGFVLYWLVNSALMLIFQLRMNRAK